MRIFHSFFRRSAFATLGIALLAGALPATAQTEQSPFLVFDDQLQFAHQIGAAAPPPQTLRIYSLPFNIPFTATVTTQTGAGWLAVNGLLQATGRTSTEGQQDIAISVSPSLQAGTYTGTVSITSGSTTRPINVQYVVGTLPVVRLDPASMTAVNVEAGATTTLPVQIAASATGPAFQYSAQVLTASPNSGWLAISPGFGQTGQAAQVIVNTTLLPPNTDLAIGTLRVTPLTGGGAVTFPISVHVAPGAQVVVTPQTVTFPYQVGFAPPAARQVNVTSSTQTQLVWTASIISAAPWLTVSTTPLPGGTTVNGNTPGSFYLVPNIGAVPSTPQTHEAVVRVQGATGESRDITARLVVSNQPQLTLQPEAASFMYTLGGTLPTTQIIGVNSTSGNQTFTVTPTYTSGGQWFTVAPATAGTTPTNLVISVDATRLSQLGAGNYAGNVRLQSSTSTIDVPINLTVSGSTLLTVEPLQPPPFEAAQGQTPTARTLTVRSTDGTNQNFTANVEYGTGASGWLIVSPTSSSTGATGTFLTLNVNPTAVSAPGTYEAQLVITPTGTTTAPAVRVPIRYVVTGTATVTANPTTVSVQQAGATPPANQTIQLTSTTQGLGWVAQSNQTWLRLVQTSGSVPGNVVVQFDSASLQPGEYTGQITIVVGGVQTLTIPVTLRVASSATLQVNVNQLNFAWMLSAPAPAAQTVNLTSTGAAIAFTATATSTVGTTNWLTVEPASGTTGAAGAAATALSVRVNPTGLTPGNYEGVVTISAPGAANPTTNINVRLTVTAAAAPSSITMVNAATNLPRGVTPGLIVVIKGRNMAPSTGQTARVVNNIVATQLGDVVVTFDGIEAPLLYVGPSGDQQGDQINAIVPYGISGRLSTRVVVQYRNIRSDAIEVRVDQSDPGIFTQTQTGSGPGSILNQDNSVNTANNAAARGSIIQIYATGEGLTAPLPTTGQVIGSTLPRPTQPVSVRIGGQPAEVVYAGGAPGLVAGVVQVNARVPQNLNVTAATALPIEVQVGQQTSQAGVTVAIRP